MRYIRSLALVVFVYSACLAVTATTPAQANAQFVYGSYGTPYWATGGYPSWFGYYNYPYYSNYPYGSTRWGGDTTWSGYPRWYVNYMRWNRPYNPYQYPYYNRYNGYYGRRW